MIMMSIPRIAAVALAVVVAGGTAWGQQIVRGPYLQWATNGSIHVVWDQDQPKATAVHYGLTPAMALTTKSNTAGTHHEVQLTGLQPGASYHYAIYSGTNKISTDLTLPAPVSAGAPFRFLAFGDTRSDHQAHQKLVDAMVLESGARFYVNTGDLVASGEVQSDWDTFFTVEAPLIGRLPLFPVIGNHDEDDGDATLYYNHVVTNPSIPVPEAYYSFDYGNSHFVALDGHVYVDEWYLCALAGKLYDCFKPAQLNWLKQDLAAAAANPAIEHIFVFIHEGPYSSKPNRSGSEQMRQLMPLFKTSGVTLVISGHDHYYERGVSGNNIPYMITGGGGAPLYTTGAPCPAPHTVVTNTTDYHYAVIDVQGPQVKVAVKTPDGKQLDQYVLGSPPPPPPPPPADAGPPAADMGQPADATATADTAATRDHGAATTPDSGVNGDAPPPPDLEGDGGGCGCVVGGPVGTGWFLPLLLLLYLRLRRGSHLLD